MGRQRPRRPRAGGTLLQAAGFRYAPFAQARYYLEHIDAYFTLFNTRRKQAEKKAAQPNTAFVKFFLEGMLAGTNRKPGSACNNLDKPARVFYIDPWPPREAKIKNTNQ